MRTLIFLITFFSSFGISANDSHNYVLVHAPYETSYSCAEHWDGQFTHLGDALGTDCLISGWYENDGRLFSSRFNAQGHDNEDWFGFRQPVLAPCDCVVDSIHLNPVTNEPGIMTPGRATSVIFKKSDGTYILYAHLRELKVAEGEHLISGQVVGLVGNNGYSRSPHIHIAAWRDKNAIQVVFDQQTIALKDRGS